MRLLSEEIAASRKSREGNRDSSAFVSGFAGKVERSRFKRHRCY